MRKIREVLRLRFELGLGQREIARACSISQGAVHSYLKKAAVAGVCWPLPKAGTNRRLNKHCSETSAPSNDPANESFPTLPLCTSNCSSIVISRGSWSGKSTGRLIRKDTATAASANCIRRWRGEQDVVLRQP